MDNGPSFGNTDPCSSRRRVRMHEASAELIKAIQAASPEVWAAAVKSVKVEAFLNAGWAALWSAIAFGFSKGTLALMKDPHSDGIWGLVLIPAVICAILAVVCADTTLRAVFAPEWKAIEKITGSFIPGGE
jgi:hypothetical protein